MSKPSYFLLAVSTKHNLNLCLRYGMAGFTNSTTGVWTFCEIQEGDYISFLYATKAYNLYKVVGKDAYKDAETIAPWPTITFRESGKTYYFPFRLHLELKREFNESLVRMEFAYIAENLLLRAGYRKTHFQADQTTLSNVSMMGNLASTKLEKLELINNTFIPEFTRKKNEKAVPLINAFQETILQAVIRQHLLDATNLAKFFELISLVNYDAKNFEVLSEKAVGEGHIDLLIKDANPIERANKIIIEVKLNKAELDNIEQLAGYMQEFGEECIAGVLIAESFPKPVKTKAAPEKIKLIEYKLFQDWSKSYNFNEILNQLTLKETL